MDNGEKDDEELLSLVLTQCANCNAFCSEGQQLCHRCALMRCCQRCRRRLPDVCFGQVDEDTCEACKRRTATKQQQRHRRRMALNERISEVQLVVPPAPENCSYDDVIRALAPDIEALVGQHLTIYRYNKSSAILATFKID